MDVMVANARRLAAALDAHPKISKVHAFGFHSTTGILGFFEKVFRFEPKFKLHVGPLDSKKS